MGLGIFHGRRQGVPYDFSTLTRGRFLVISAPNPDVFRIGMPGKKDSADATVEAEALANIGKPSKCFYAQINPESLFITDKPFTVDIDEIGIDSDKDQAIPCIKSLPNKECSELRMILKFDMFDEYKIRTMDGALPVQGCDLISDGNNALNALRNLAGSRFEWVYFTWGPIEWIGIVESIETEFKCFSRWGEPLKADATVVIKQPFLGSHKENGIDVPNRTADLKLGMARTMLAGNLETEIIAKRALIGASQALR